MDSKAIIDALQLTPDNIRELVEIEQKTYQGRAKMCGEYLASVEQYESETGAGTFAELPFIDKLLCTYRHAMLKGYLEALCDVYKAQQEGMKAIQE